MRWYSPRDYIEEEVIDEKGNVVLKGELSARMKIPSNMWVEAWETAKPIPARRQRRLFDDTREAEKVTEVWVSNIKMLIIVLASKNLTIIDMRALDTFEKQSI